MHTNFGFRHFVHFEADTCGNSACVYACKQQDPHSPSPYTALILHRLALDCGMEAQNLGFNCTTTQGQVRIETHTHLHTKRNLNLFAVHACALLLK